MGDTGSPWNIPFAEPSFLVRDWPALSEDVADAVAAGLTDASVIRQVLQASKVDVFSSTSSSFVDVTGLEVSITPESNTNKVLVICEAYCAISNTAGDRSSWVLARGTTALNANNQGNSLSLQRDERQKAIFAFLDSPGTDSAVTYRLRQSSSQGTGHVNRDSGSDTLRGSSTITVIEVAA
jgi:hypothetical protein